MMKLLVILLTGVSALKMNEYPVNSTFHDPECRAYSGCAVGNWYEKDMRSHVIKNCCPSDAGEMMPCCASAPITEVDCEHGCEECVETNDVCCTDGCMSQAANDAYTPGIMSCDDYLRYQGEIPYNVTCDASFLRRKFANAHFGKHLMKEAAAGKKISMRQGCVCAPGPPPCPSCGGPTPRDGWGRLKGLDWDLPCVRLVCPRVPGTLSWLNQRYDCVDPTQEDFNNDPYFMPRCWNFNTGTWLR